jgi:hypothetical protein
MLQELTVLSVNTDDCIALQNWKLSLHSNGFQHVTILGMGQAWKGFDWRSKMYLRHLQHLRQKWGPNHIVLTADSTDVIFVQNQDVLLHRFKQFNKRVVISADATQFVGQFANATSRQMARNIIMKRLDASANAKVSTSPYIWINAGLCMGYVDDMMRLYGRITNYKDDQEGVQMEWLSDPTLCYLDTHQQLFGTVCGLEYLGQAPKSGMLKQISLTMSNQWKQTITGTCPCIMHFPGKITSPYNAFIMDWQTALLSQHATAWQHKLECIPSRNLGGFAFLKGAASTCIRAHRKEISTTGTVLLIAFVLMSMVRLFRKSHALKTPMGPMG